MLGGGKVRIPGNRCFFCTSRLLLDVDTITSAQRAIIVPPLCLYITLELGNLHIHFAGLIYSGEGEMLRH